MRWILLFTALFVIAFRYQALKPQIPEGVEIVVRGSISREPVHYDTSSLVTLNSVRVYISRYPEAELGDYLELRGVYERGIIRRAEVIKLAKSQNLLHKLRRLLLHFYEKHLPRRDFALVSGVVLGSQSGISKNFQDELTRAGVIHVVVASGTNVVFVSAFMMSILLLLMKRKQALLFSLVGVLGYVFISGFSPPLVRAALMGGVASLSQVTGRLSSNLRNLVMVCVFMLLVNPLWIEDLGFIMSVLATSGLILFETKINRLISFVPQMIRQDLSTTLAAQLGVLPILIGVFGNFNIISPVVNVLVLWTVPLIMIIGVLAGVIGIMFEPIGNALLIIMYPLTQWFINIVHLFA